MELSIRLHYRVLSYASRPQTLDLGLHNNFVFFSKFLMFMDSACRINDGLIVQSSGKVRRLELQALFMLRYPTDIVWHDYMGNLLFQFPID